MSSEKASNSPGLCPIRGQCKRLSQHSSARMIVSMKNSNDTIGNRTHVLSASIAQCLNQVRHSVPPPPIADKYRW